MSRPADTPPGGETVFATGDPDTPAAGPARALGLSALRRVFSGLMVAAVLFTAGACSLVRIKPEAYGDEVSAVRSLEPVRQRLEWADAASASLLLTDIGRVEHLGVTSVFWRMVYRPFVPGLKRILILAGVRGNEAAGVESALAAIERLGAPAGPDALFNADFLPVVNPWGWAHGRGRNPQKVDIGLDFGSFDSREARIIRRFLRDKRYDLVIDLREDIEAAGFSIHLFGMDATATAERILSEAGARGYPIEGRAAGPRTGLVTISNWQLTLREWLGSVSLPAYARRHVAGGVYMIVTPTILPLADRVALQRMAIEALIAEHAAPPAPLPSGAPGS